MDVNKLSSLIQSGRGWERKRFCTHEVSQQDGLKMHETRPNEFVTTAGPVRDSIRGPPKQDAGTVHKFINARLPGRCNPHRYALLQKHTTENHAVEHRIWIPS